MADSITSGEKTLLRADGHKAELFLSILVPDSILVARLNNADAARGDRSIVYDGGSGSAPEFARILAGQPLWVGTTAGDNDRGVTRVKAITGTATSKEHVLSAVKAGVSDYLIKPFDLGILRGKLGTKVCGENISLRSDPSDKRCPGTPFQGGGLVSPTLDWIKDGVVETLSYSRFWAKKQGKEPTGMPSNIIMDGGDAKVEDMIASTEKGILVTRFWYIRFVDPMVPLVTGMTRDGLFLIENGKVTRPIKHMRFNERLLDLFNRVEEMGQPERTGEYIGMLVPTIKVKDFNCTSTTKF